MKRRGPTCWTFRTPAPRLEEVLLAIETARETPREIFTRLDLQRYVKFPTFRRFVTDRRRVNRARQGGMPGGGVRMGTPRWPGRYGTRGVARLRRIGFAALGPVEMGALTWGTLLDIADSLRLMADKLASLAERFGPGCTVPSKTNTESAEAASGIAAGQGADGGPSGHGPPGAEPGAADAPAAVPGGERP